MGLVSNIARPGGNITGIAIDAGPGIWGKRIGLLKEALPKLSNVGVLMQTRKDWESPYGSAILQAAKAANIALNAVVFDGKIDETEYQCVFEAFEQDRPEAIMVAEFAVHFTNRVTIVGLAAKYRLPAMYTIRGSVEIGGLMAYSFDFEEVGRSSGYQMGQILMGTNPRDIPFNQITRLQLSLQPQDRKITGP